MDTILRCGNYPYSARVLEYEALDFVFIVGIVELLYGNLYYAPPLSDVLPCDEDMHCAPSTHRYKLARFCSKESDFFPKRPRLSYNDRQLGYIFS